jgi:hypothetical protein
LTWSIPESLTLLKKHDRELVKFYPYSSNDTYYIECWMIIKPYNVNNQKFKTNCNIKLYSKNFIDTLTVDLEQLNKIEFINGESFYLSEYDIVPNYLEYYQNKEQVSKIKNQVQKSVIRYGNFDFDILSLASILIPNFNEFLFLKEIQVPVTPNTNENLWLEEISI